VVERGGERVRERGGERVRERGGERVENLTFSIWILFTGVEPRDIQHSVLLISGK
jgi:hypothetical protein